MTKNEFYKTVVKSIVTITSTVENEFEESVLKCAAKSTTIVKQEETLVTPPPTLKCSAKFELDKSVVGGQM